MATKNNKLGKVVFNHQGYSVRQLIERTTEGKKIPTGKYAIFAGKKFISNKDELFKNKEEAIKNLKKMVKLVGK